MNSGSLLAEDAWRSRRRSRWCRRRARASRVPAPPAGSRRRAGGAPGRWSRLSCGELFGMTLRSATPCRRAGSSRGRPTATTPACARATRRDARASAASPRGPGSSTTSSSGPLKPGPEALGEQVVGLARVEPAGRCPRRRARGAATGTAWRHEHARATPTAVTATGGAAQPAQRAQTGDSSVALGPRRRPAACAPGRAGAEEAEQRGQQRQRREHRERHRRSRAAIASP